MNIAEAILKGKQTLDSESTLLDTELLLAHVLKKNRTFLFTWPETTLTTEQTHDFLALLEQRKTGHPIAHLIGHREFWGLELLVNQHTLIPRPDTEILVEQALDKLALTSKKQQDSLRVLDLGTGSGAIICALKHEVPTIDAFACDYQIEALKIARENASRLGLPIQFLQGSWFEPLRNQTFDIIVSNPPYITENDEHLVIGDVKFEPITALTSGEDGLEDIRHIISEAPNFLNAQGWLLIEHGYHQASSVHQLFKENQFQQIELIYDYGNQPRVTLGQIPSTGENS